MYQVISHALKIKDDKTKFTLIFANVSPADILLKEEFEAFKKNYPDRFEPIFIVDKAEANWSGTLPNQPFTNSKEFLKCLQHYQDILAL